MCKKVACCKPCWDNCKEKLKWLGKGYQGEESTLELDPKKLKWLGKGYQGETNTFGLDWTRTKYLDMTDMTSQKLFEVIFFEVSIELYRSRWNYF